MAVTILLRTGLDNDGDGLTDCEDLTDCPRMQKKRVRKMAKLWGEWWQENKENYVWDAETRREKCGQVKQGASQEYE